MLDVTTLVVMGCFAIACAGLVLLVAWYQDRKTSALALWGFADLGTAFGILSLMFGSLLHQPMWPVLGSVALAYMPGLIWKAARALDAQPAPLGIALLGGGVVTLAAIIPATRHIAWLLSFVAATTYLFAAAGTLWLGRKQKLAARWPIIILTGVHATVLAVGTYSTFSGALGQGKVPSLLSLFGIIHFENIVFSLGTAAFILAFVKEHSEAASKMAARIDPLTGIANRTSFMESAERVIERCRREGLPVSVMMCDLDRFKAINDTYGHAVGDAVIRKFCEVVTALLRPNDVFGRMGGEEFAVVLPRSSIEAALARADRIQACFAENCRFIEGHQVAATVSCGLAASVNAEETLLPLLELSDVALYRAKAEGRNRVKRVAQPNSKGVSSIIRVA
jgi:diguanylate cyclase (GGDEF)-like protein